MDCALPFISGGALALGWFIMVDGLATTPLVHDADRLVLVPGIVGSVALAMVMLTPFRALAPHDNFLAVAPSGGACARLWLFVAMVLSLASLYAGVALTTSSNDVQRALGAHAALQAVALAVSAGTWAARRLMVGDPMLY